MSENDRIDASGADNGAADQSNHQTSGQPDMATLQAQLREQTARATKAEQDNAALRGEMDAIRPYVRYGNDQPAYPPANQSQQPDDENLDPVERLQNQVHSLGQQLQQTQGDLIARTFFLENPDLRDNEDLVTTMFAQTPGRSVHDRLRLAGQKARDWIKNHDNQVLERAEQERKKKTRSVNALDGVMDGSVTPPTPPEPEEKADLGSYSAMRAAESNASHGGS